MNPWFVAVGTWASAKAPMVARDVIRIDPGGCSSLEHESSPACVIRRLVVKRYGDLSAVMSLGVAQQRSPFQYEGSDVLGVAPPKTSHTSPNVIESPPARTAEAIESACATSVSTKRRLVSTRSSRVPR